MITAATLVLASTVGVGNVWESSSRDSQWQHNFMSSQSSTSSYSSTVQSPQIMLQQPVTSGAVTYSVPTIQYSVPSFQYQSLPVLYQAPVRFRRMGPIRSFFGARCVSGFG